MISIDLGGGSLSQRGWRREAGTAPLREHLAAVLLMLARFDSRKDALVDPMCGAGTIPIEAFHLSRATPRKTPTLAALGLGQPAAPLYADASPLLVGCDFDLEVLAAARDNARAAGCADAITWQRVDVAGLHPDLIAQIARERGREPTTGVLLSNPPYGERLDEGELEELYGAIAATVAASRAGAWRSSSAIRCSRTSILAGDSAAADQEATREREPARVLLSLRAMSFSRRARPTRR